MNKLHKVLHLLMALMLVGFALPGIAQTKYFSASAAAVVPNGTTTGVTFTFYNATPKPGVSTINSVLITPPPNVLITCSTIKLLGAPKPGTGAPYNDGLNSCVVNGFTGIPNQSSGTFSFTTTVNPPQTCASGVWDSAANTGNTFPQGTPFSVSPGGTKTPSSGVGCTGSVACGGTFLASASGAGPGDPGYVSVEVSNTFKDGTTSCAGTTFFFSSTNTLLIDNKLIVLLSDPNAAFTATVNSAEFPVDGTGYASRRLKVSWEVFDALHTINAPTCSCSAASMACMPLDKNDPPDLYFGQMVRVCVTDYTWSLGDQFDTFGNRKVKYQAIVNAIGNDPQFGFE